MTEITIRQISDEYECETCGPSFAEGFIITVGEKEILLEPDAHCYDSVSYDYDDVLKAVAESLGHTVKIE